MSPTDLATLIATVVGSAISLIFSYVPAVSKWFYALEEQYRGLVMVGVNVLVTLALFGLTCSGWYVTVSCDVVGGLALLRALFLALAANQITYLMTPTSPTKLALQK